MTKMKEKTFVSTTRPVPPTEKSKVLTTHDLPSDLSKVVTERFWDKEKTMKKPAITTSDVALSESEEEKIRRDEIMAEIKKQKEKK